MSLSTTTTTTKIRGICILFINSEKFVLIEKKSEGSYYVCMLLGFSFSYHCQQQQNYRTTDSIYFALFRCCSPACNKKGISMQCKFYGAFLGKGTISAKRFTQFGASNKNILLTFND